MPRAIDQSDPIDVFVGQRIKEARIALGSSQTDLGRALGVSFQQVQKYETGANRVSASMLMRASRTLKLSVSHFFPSDQDDRSPAQADTDAVRGSKILAQYFAKMPSSRRSLLIEVARTFANDA